MIAALSAAAALLLVVSGVIKLRAPAPAASMIAALLGRRQPARPLAVRLTVRLIGLVEISVGAAVLTFGGRIAAVLLALTYAIFAVVALRLLGPVSATSAASDASGASGATTRSGRPACGCFGRTDAPVSAAHVALDLVVVGCAVAAAFTSLPPGAGVFSHSAADAVIGGAQVLLLAWLGYLTITALPALSAARRLLTPMPEEAR